MKASEKITSWVILANSKVAASPENLMVMVTVISIQMHTKCIHRKPFGLPNGSPLLAGMPCHWTLPGLRNRLIRVQIVRLGRKRRSINSPRTSKWAALVIFAMALSAQTERGVTAQSAAKLVEIDKTQQHLRASDGGKLVLQSRISTGKWDGSTPNGRFRVGRKFLMHYSRLYDNAPMPYSVHIVGNVFIHGFSYVPPWPASHGCIRLPLAGDNPARRFYHRVEPGTPVNIIGRWQRRSGSANPHTSLPSPNQRPAFRNSWESAVRVAPMVLVAQRDAHERFRSKAHVRRTYLTFRFHPHPPNDYR